MNTSLSLVGFQAIAEIAKFLALSIKCSIVPSVLQTQMFPLLVPAMTMVSAEFQDAAVKISLSLRLEDVRLITSSQDSLFNTDTEVLFGIARHEPELLNLSWQTVLLLLPSLDLGIQSKLFTYKWKKFIFHFFLFTLSFL